MYTEDTIVAISTPAGHSGIGIVRISGSDAIKIADRLFVSPKNNKLKLAASHKIIYGNIVNPKDKEIADEVLVSVMKAPATYTREDIVEINCHGGPVPLRRILELVLEYGARLAEPGEFTRRAFLNGRIDLAQAEAVLDVIHSLTEQSRKTAVEQLRGGLSKKTEAVRQELVELTALVEAHIDFPEDDIEPLSLKDMKKRAQKIKLSLQKLIDSSRYGMILREGLKTAIIGRPNVGKSSLLNALLEHERAIVTEMPGTTRDVIEEYLNINGLPVKIMDTAGIREVKDIAEKEGVKRSLAAMDEADLVLLVLDGSEIMHETDRELIEKSKLKSRIIVINKTDLTQKISLKKLEQSIANKWFTDKNKKVIAAPDYSIRGQAPTGIQKKDWIPGQARNDRAGQETVRISATRSTGLDELREKITQIVSGGNADSGTGVVTNVRHVRALEKALSSVDSFIREVAKKTSPEFISVELRDALDAIGDITGITTSDEILDRIFSSFCIGK